MLDDAIAILACAHCPSLSKSTSSALSGLLYMKSSIRAFHVSKRWNTFSTTDSSLSFSATTCVVSTSDTEFSLCLSVPKNMTIAKTPDMKRVVIPSSFPSCVAGTRPMSIIMKTTIQSNAAVERFSSMMSGMKNMHTVNIYLKACLSAPFSVCIALRICDTASTSVPLAISDGWN